MKDSKTVINYVSETEDDNQIQTSLKQKFKKIFTKENVSKKFPIIQWLPRYNSTNAVGDLVAGFTVGLTVIPQALAYAGIANLPAVYGLYGSFLGCFMYMILGKCKEMPMGPTAIASLLVMQAAEGIWQLAVLLCLFSGIIELLMGLLGLGFIVDFVSEPVSSGFTSAVALIILTSQVRDVFGIPAKGGTFIQMWMSIGENFHHARVGDTVLGLSSIVILLVLRVSRFTIIYQISLKFENLQLLPNISIGPKDDSEKTKFQKIFTNTLWMVGTAKNAILVIAGGFLSAYFHSTNRSDMFITIGEIPQGLPHFSIPPFTVPEIRNETSGEIIQNAMTFREMISKLGSNLIVVPLISLLETIAICKAFNDGDTIDASQELIAIGTANIANSFVQGFPGNGSLSRGAVKNSSGVQTPLSSLYTGILVILSLLFFTDAFFYIPKAALGGLIIAAVIFMVDYKVVKPMWRSKKSDLIPGLSAFVGCLALPLELGILVGIGINILFILHQSARPKIHVETMRTVRNCVASYILILIDFLNL